MAVLIEAVRALDLAVEHADHDGASLGVCQCDLRDRQSGRLLPHALSVEPLVLGELDERLSSTSCG